MAAGASLPLPTVGGLAISISVFQPERVRSVRPCFEEGGGKL